MKKIFILAYFMIGGSLVMFMASLMGCVGQAYNFIYKFSGAQFYETNGSTIINYTPDSVAYNHLNVSETLLFQVIASNFNNNFGNRLYAYQPPDPVYTPIEKITSIKIYTVSDYNTTYPAGSDITAIVKFSGINGYNGNYYSEQQILDVMNQKITSSSPRLALNFQLKEPPEISGNQQFIFEIQTAINDILRDVTPIIYIEN